MREFIKKLKSFAQKIANIQIRIILFIVYFIFITPFGIFIRWFADYLRIKSSPSWQTHKEIFDISDFLRKQ